MKFVSLREIRNRPGGVFKILKKEQEAVLTSKGKPVALLVDLDEKNFEKQLSRYRGMSALWAMQAAQEASKRNGRDKLTDAEIQAEIRTARRRLRG